MRPVHCFRLKTIQLLEGSLLRVAIDFQSLIKYVG